MKFPPRTQNAVCQAGLPRRLSSPTTSICALPTLSTPDFTSYSIFSPTANGTLACLTLAAIIGWAGVDAVGVCAVESEGVNAAKAAIEAKKCLTRHLPGRRREHAPCG